ncbi:roadblock/LC7 domain-containing protein [Streptomyces sp. NPDC057552]|uniref:roadblock/LC7 domain-containing protein n=1 Tax=Streptomyces sp. NPDC057552 TaxID=3350537 RepID=UPI003689512D
MSDVRFTSAGLLPQQNRHSEMAQKLLEVTGAVAVILSSQDGLLVGAHQGTEREDAEKMAALGTSLLAASSKAAVFYPATEGGASGVRQLNLEREDGSFVILAKVGPGVTVALFTGARTDLSSAAYEIAKFAQWFAPGVADRAEA